MVRRVLSYSLFCRFISSGNKIFHATFFVVSVESVVEVKLDEETSLHFPDSRMKLQVNLSFKIAWQFLNIGQVKLYHGF